MPDQNGMGCAIPGNPVRPDVPAHMFMGSNTWVLKAIQNFDADGDSNLDTTLGTPLTQTTVDDMVADAIARNTQMLQDATDLFLFKTFNDELKVRLVNLAGHKVPTGFPDGRRMWVNVQYFDGNDVLAVEHGNYDFVNGILTAGDTKVYEIKLGIDATQAAATGVPEGETFHFMLANTIAKDNRIPAVGYSNNGAALTQTTPVGASYIDGQHWDDTFYAIPECAEKAVVNVYYQLISRDYIEFLRDTNATNDAGQTAYDLWEDPAIGNMSAPVLMDSNEIVLAEPADVNDDGIVGVDDLLEMFVAWGPCPPGPCPADLNCDGTVGVDDFLLLLARWGNAAPALAPEPQPNDGPYLSPASGRRSAIARHRGALRK